MPISTKSTELQHPVLVFLVALFASGGAPQNLSQRRVALLDRRREDDTTSTSVCVRWSHQAATVGSIMYIYGGQAKTEASQTTDTWNSNFLALSLNDNWDTSSPKLTGFPKPEGPPPVANGYLWHNSNQLFLYGGLFSDVDPKTPPPDFQLWQYDISSRKWSTVDTSVSSDSGLQDIQRAAEGAGVSIPGRSMGFYFGGHLDGYTTHDWSQSVPRVYLKSMLEYDMDKKQFNNITKAGLENAGVPERADGVLVFVPWGPEGILLAIGGGTNATFSQMNMVDVYDLSSKKWTKQSTDGSTPQYRVNPCAAVASASDGSSHNVYFFGGQNLVPYAKQKQYDDMWILTIPAFKWIQVDQKDQSVPPARAGHTCDIVGSQMVVVGGFVGDQLSCDSPGIYVFDTSKLQWVTGYSAALGGFGSGNGRGSSGGQSGSGGRGAYRVPESVISVVGGDGDGGATVTEPFKMADPSGPIATGNPTQYKYTTFLSAPVVHVTTSADGSVTTATTTPSPGADGPNPNGPKIGAIVGSVVGGLVLLVSLLLALAYWLYRRKVSELRYNSLVNTDFDKQDSLLHRKGSSFSSSGNKPSVVDLNELQGEPSFWGVLLSPRRSLRVVNH